MDVSSILEVKGFRVETIRADATVAATAEALARHRIGALIVMDGDAIGGVISERDIVRGLVEHGARLGAVRVAELMTRAVVTCRPTDPIESVMAIMTHHRVRHVPVVEGGALVGIVSIGDVVKHRLDALESETSLLREFITRQ